MSRENVEIVRSWYGRLNAHDPDGCVDLLADSFELVQPSLPDAGPYLGPAGLRRWFERMEEAWSEMRWETLEFIDAGEYVVVPVRFVTRGAHTAIEQVAERFQIARVQEGRITFATGYESLDQALEAVGLSE